MEKQLIQTEQFRKSQVPPRNMLQFFQEQKCGLCCEVCRITFNSAQKLYNIIAKMKKKRMQGRNTVEEVICLSAQWGYTVFYRNCNDSNILNDIVVAHPTSIQM
ncbi:hypothetical protein M9H77_23707 [Catharanthus roseus]|uniref:Uncharacterized protein n=1 Tax=Catharanthus roseus TaxID=4058 RepID=A0ACC0AV19_CATRO|nr:hypothetical protein M9H77_23707 [Catharanthus roseus]